MNYREQVAHHEAAHVVISHIFRGGPTAHGIDINAPSSMIGAFGNAGVQKLVHDPALPKEEQRNDLIKNVAMTCAGAAADARTMNRPLTQALLMQLGDLKVAQTEIAQSPLIPTSGRSPSTVQVDRDEALQAGLETAEHHLARPDIWALVEKIAKACLANGGKLSKEEIEDLL
ncbi:hypothetical protein MKK65_03730 [Methylobacterium sp. J-001]|uniref:hypothetical protein n=1 Tax=Methylobacterium sp. J-001 TaxID=2836609 RepID=UPI001FB99D77|nr:hypothetical protein [Methylobacterium sp. J-001]MCJ2115710.1 hypothetical protein [Methylobacterium sp. J-001]